MTGKAWRDSVVQGSVGGMIGRENLAGCHPEMRQSFGQEREEQTFLQRNIFDFWGDRSWDGGDRGFGPPVLFCENGLPHRDVEICHAAQDALVGPRSFS